MDENASDHTTIDSPRTDMIATWQQILLYGRIVIGLVLGVIAGLTLGNKAVVLAVPGKLVLRLLGALASQRSACETACTAAVVKHVNREHRQTGRRQCDLTRARCWTITIVHRHHAQRESAHHFFENVPKSLLGPLGDDGKVIGVILVAVAFCIPWLGFSTAAGRRLMSWVT